MEDNRLFELLGKKLSGEAGEKELAELNQLLAMHPDALFTLETMQQYWQADRDTADRQYREAALQRHLQRLSAVSRQRAEGVQGAGTLASEEGADPRHAGALAPDDGADPRQAETRGHDEAVHPKKHPGLKRIMGWITIAAAAAILTFVLTRAFQPAAPAPAPVLASATEINFTTTTGRRKVQLPDGSTAWLNSMTKLRYVQQPGGYRTVELEGEAYFNVKRDPGHPFFVHTANLQVRDLGTAFNIKAYHGDKTDEATLLEGAIEVRLNWKNAKAILSQPHQKFIAYAGREDDARDDDHKTPDTISGAGAYQIAKAIPVKTDSLLEETAWMKNMLVFRNESFGELAARMERWFGVTIQFVSAAPQKYRFTGAFEKETLVQALQELQLMRSFQYIIAGKTVTIKK
jgi:ferric-dicitrate binding protein FerR (iron transport regulator)